ncbi:hypothetical protein JTE90_029431, partial [Oedothorax gibbosus]
RSRPPKPPGLPGPSPPGAYPPGPSKPPDEARGPSTQNLTPKLDPNFPDFPSPTLGSSALKGVFPLWGEPAPGFGFNREKNRPKENYISPSDSQEGQPEAHGDTPDTPTRDAVFALLAFLLLTVRGTSSAPYLRERARFCMTNEPIPADRRTQIIFQRGTRKPGFTKKEKKEKILTLPPGAGSYVDRRLPSFGSN